MEYTKLNSGYNMPILGYGVYKVDPVRTEELVSQALKNGYRLIDTAQYYRNEEGVGKAINNSGVPRSEIFLTTKLAPNGGYNETKDSIDKSLRALNQDYIDLLLIHWPGSDYLGMWKAMEEAVESGKVRSIGLSNFYGKEFDNIVNNAHIMPAVDQNETHVFRQQFEIQDSISKFDTKLEAWSPLTANPANVMNNSTLKNLSDKYQKSVAQIMLRSLIQREIIAIPKTTHEDRMIENIDIFDFSLTDEDMNEIKQLDKDVSLFGWL
ncbi:aldo/keto reductase [Companilactobacillus metriopterae]|uniref:aldo/keto reductase n=1 Tax=Companilactobacillus metriopterae TaxID=1909267 RepID=UPI00100C1670|nr:aldo/keto reductase [Companilactobacillus metriopterae]